MSLLKIGQVLRGRLGKYVITRQIQETVWFAQNQACETVVIKGVHGHPRVENERDVLKRFRRSATHLRPVIDETLNRNELKYVARCILEALDILHTDGYVHTDVKLDNIFVNYKDGENRFSDVQLGDLGGSPEVLMETPWNTATDIWSFGTALISLIYGGDFNLFRPRTVPYGHEEYNLEVLKQQFRYFGPFPEKYAEIASPETVPAILYLMHEIPQQRNVEVSLKDKAFISKIMMLDWRDRPTAKELLRDKWFQAD
ncbi:hypothetical protein P175DRAFT_0513207 [Aspergillus ochraceoroseus IBT 24754]|uniref:Protein kinase domain-containing protein n=1 Tax=Aspergillus ochraceoroseus IBT 24754 TaxID=1392256 RepID=A0A2T5M6K8_9EURO|nr:uncharacterized protein P175DRAFT_0513207 [Aspergillus ochraceoroseus IBT 24754]PTU24175.1 hypothetical protein P175DRAFT_0513207 [Aspergillus ochraceoroseus IBT 24754]